MIRKMSTVIVGSIAAAAFYIGGAVLDPAPAIAATQCGTINHGYATTRLVIKTGSISCATARKAMNAYVAALNNGTFKSDGTRAGAYVNGWHCNTHGAGFAQTSGVSSYCEKRSSGAQVQELIIRR